jgi:hypothetical protein
MLVHSVSGSCNRPSISASSRPPRWPSLARWSPASVSITTGHGITTPSTTQGRVTMRPMPTIATCGGYMIGNTVSAPRSPRLVIVTVGSVSSELRVHNCVPAAPGRASPPSVPRASACRRHGSPAPPARRRAARSPSRYARVTGLEAVVLPKPRSALVASLLLARLHAA